MASTAWILLHALSGQESGRNCRRCSESIPSSDRFGMSEGVCRACRLHPDG
jgi:hypothetical protein